MITSIRNRFLFTVGTNFFRSLISFTTGVLLARLLGPVSYGNMAFMLGSFMGILSLLNMGSSSAFFTFMSQRTRSRRFVWSFFLWVAIQLRATLIVIGLLFPVHWIDYQHVPESKNHPYSSKSLGYLAGLFLPKFHQGSGLQF